MPASTIGTSSGQASWVTRDRRVGLDDGAWYAPDSTVPAVAMTADVAAARGGRGGNGTRAGRRRAPGPASASRTSSQGARRGRVAGEDEQLHVLASEPIDGLERERAAPPRRGADHTASARCRRGRPSTRPEAGDGARRGRSGRRPRSRRRRSGGRRPTSATGALSRSRARATAREGARRARSAIWTTSCEIGESGLEVTNAIPSLFEASTSRPSETTSKSMRLPSACSTSALVEAAVRIGAVEDGRRASTTDSRWRRRSPPTSPGCGSPCCRR